jgi:hypothetical protein
MIFRGGEFSTGEMGNFHPALTHTPHCVERRSVGAATLEAGREGEQFPLSAYYPVNAAGG